MKLQLITILVCYLLCSSSVHATILQVSAGGRHNVGLKSDGTVVAVGYNYNGQLNVGSWTDIQQVSAGGRHTVGLKSDGTVVAVGDNYYGQLNVGSWTDIQQVSAGTIHTVGLKSDGTVVAVGSTSTLYGHINVASWADIQQVGAGVKHTIGLKSDGTVVAVGDNSYGQLNVGSWTDIQQVSAGGYYTVGLKSDGTVVGVGDNSYGQLNVSSLAGIQQVSAAGWHTVGLKSDGTVVSVGWNQSGLLNPASWTDIQQLSAGGASILGLKLDGTVVATGGNSDGELNVESWNLNLLSISVNFKGEGGGVVHINQPETYCTSDCTVSYQSEALNTLITLNAVSFSDSIFTGWSGACTGTDPCYITMDGAKSVEANFDHFTSTLPYTLRRLSQTRYGIDSKNYDNDWPNGKEDAAAPNTITHALYPFQLYGMSGVVAGFRFIENNVESVLALKTEEEDSRQPLILIHGWQADKNGDYLNRDPAELSKTPADNNYDAEGYWWTFLRYFNTNDELKRKYKLYVYQYPSYKHITFNARMLSNMLYEVKYIRDWIAKGKKITIVAHSMGGLLARSMLEEHGGIWFREGGVWNLFESGKDMLDKLITLDTPHHGSPAAVYPWLDMGLGELILTPRDLLSPGAMDLWWDGYDNAFLKISEDNSFDLLDVDILNPLRSQWEESNIGGDPTNSWRINGVRSFDLYYRPLSGSMNYVNITNNAKTVFVRFNFQPNPWLTYLNEKKHDPVVWRGKYIFYGGYNDSQTGHWANKLKDTGVIGGGDNFWFTGVWEAGYLNDAPVPVTSSFFDKLENVVNHAGWPSSNQIDMFSDFIADKNKTILQSVNGDGFKIRFFRDYHHDRMLNGAYDHAEHGYIPESTTNEGWQWDLITKDELLAPHYAIEWHDWQTRTYTGFETNQYRLDYIKDAGVQNTTIDEMYVLNQNDSMDDTWKSTLEYEPLFLLLRNDLLPIIPGDINGDFKVDLRDTIYGLKVVAGQQLQDVHTSADVDIDGKISMAEVLYTIRVASAMPSVETHQFDGEWYSSVYNYSFLINGNSGVATLSNSPQYKVGDLILKITQSNGNSFTGLQMFTDGNWYSVSGIMPSESVLEMQGGGYLWEMTKE